MNRSYILILFVLFAGYSCKQRANTPTNSTAEQSKESDMKKAISPDCIILDTLSIPEKESIMQYATMEKQKTENARSEYARDETINIVYDEEELYRIFPVADIWLRNKGYQPVSNEDFKNKVKAVYNIDISVASDQLESDHNYVLDISDMDLYREPYGPHLGYTYFVKNKNFIFRPTLDESFAKFTKNTEDGRLCYTCFKPSLLHQNRFLFNDSKASLTWLINNDMEFLEMLVKDFGYDTDDRINKVVLEKAYKLYTPYEQPRNRKALRDLFSKVDSDGNLHIREGLMRYVVQTSTVEDYFFAEMLFNYGHDLLFHDSGLVESDRYKIIAYIGYYDELVREKNNIGRLDSPDYVPPGWYAGSLIRSAITKDDNVLEYLENNDYYGFSDYREIVNMVLYQIEDTWIRYEAARELRSESNIEEEPAP